MKFGDVKAQRGACVLTDLPANITENIISRLSIKRIFNCGSVCKYWYNVISSPQFAKAHFEREIPVCPLIRTSAVDVVSRTLYVLDPEDEQEYDVRNCTCPFGYTFTDSGRHAHIKIDAKLKLPLHNYEKHLEIKDLGKKDHLIIKPIDSVQDIEFDYVSPNHQGYNVENSCNGLVLLCKISRNRPAAICNPLTGEFVKLPESRQPIKSPRLFVSCLGYNPKSNEYKVVRISDGGKAELITVGMGSWKNVERAPCGSIVLKYPTYFSGALHWLYVIRKIIVVFDIGKEIFIKFPLPDADFLSDCSITEVSMGVLKGCLHVCYISPSRNIELWLLKEYGDSKSWTRELSVCIEHLYMWRSTRSRPVKYLANGAVLMFQSSDCLIYYNLSTGAFKYFMFPLSSYEVIPYVPSFVLLRDSLMGANVEVLNVKSRCAKLKLIEEVKEPHLVEDDRLILKELSDSSSAYYSSDSDSSADTSFKPLLLKRRLRG